MDRSDDDYTREVSLSDPERRPESNFDSVRQYAQKLPRSFQEELFDFVQYLLMKAEQQEKQDWASLSLSSAMRDIEDEPALYSISDIRVNFA